MNAIIDVLSSNDLLFYQLFTREKRRTHRLIIPINYWASNELLPLFAALVLVSHQENALSGNTSKAYETKCSLSDKKLDNIMIENLEPQPAWNFLQQNTNAVLVDVRTKTEYTDIGHPIGAIHIAWQEQFGSPVNANFIAEVGKVAPNKNTPVLLLCRSGQRSLSAAKALEQSGYSIVINIVNGFEGDPDNNQQRGNLNGWRFHGLPWQQS